MAGRRVRADDVEGRRARVEAVLAAAGELIERWGYDKTTVEDVAKAAGIAKGTVYLHWKTREALFIAVLRRERVLMLAAVRDRLAAEPGPRALFRHLAAALIGRPLLRAVLLNDLAVLGRLAERMRSGTEARSSSFTDFLDTLRDHGAVSGMWDERGQITLVNAAYLGVLTTVSLMPEELRLSDDEQADLIADTIARTLGLTEGDDPAALDRATAAYFESAFAVAQRELAETMGLDGGGST
ncbi:MAG: helix-turn-helix domain-containing protein [Umezawaea sp.]